MCAGLVIRVRRRVSESIKLLEDVMQYRGWRLVGMISPDASFRLSAIWRNVSNTAVLLVHGACALTLL